MRQEVSLYGEISHTFKGQRTTPANALHRPWFCDEHRRASFRSGRCWSCWNGAPEDL